MTSVRNDLFSPNKGLVRGRSRPVEASWYLIKCVFFLSAFPWPSALRVLFLRLFGATVGDHVYIKPRVNIHFPWKLILHDHVWIGEEVFILNFEPVEIGRHACISQRTFLCAGNHDYRDPAMGYRNQPITIGAGAWVGAQCFVAPGVVIETECVVTAGSIVTQSQPARMVCSGNPCIAVKPRWKSAE